MYIEHRFTFVGGTQRKRTGYLLENEPYYAGNKNKISKFKITIVNELEDKLDKLKLEMENIRVEVTDKINFPENHSITFTKKKTNSYWFEGRYKRDLKRYAK